MYSKKVNPYSLKKNVSCMAMAFSKPNPLLNFFLKGPSFLYSVIPLIVFTVFYEILYILDYFFKEPDFIPVIAQIFQISDIQYNLYQIFLFPVIHLADFFVFGGLIYVLSRLFQIKIDTVKTLLFFMFIFNTIGLVSAVTDALRFVWESEFLIYVHPLTGVVFFVYLSEYIHKQAEIKRWKSCILSVASLAVTLGVRIIFLG